MLNPLPFSRFVGCVCLQDEREVISSLGTSCFLSNIDYNIYFTKSLDDLFHDTDKEAEVLRRVSEVLELHCVRCTALGNPRQHFKKVPACMGGAWKCSF